MKRFLACLMSAVLVVGLLPASAFAEGGARFGGALTPLGTPEGAIGAADATFVDANLFNAVVEQLSSRGIDCTVDTASKNIRLTEDNNAAVTELDLSSKGISNASGLSEFTALEELDLSHNLLTSADGFSALTRLEHLDLHDNAVHDFSGLSGMSSLTYLDLGENNEIGSKAALNGLEALATLENLTYLDFSANRAPEVLPHLKGLVKLEYLNLQQAGSVKWNSNSAEVGIRDLGDLEGLVNLKTLILSHNCVSGIAALSKMSQLEELVLHDNTLYRENGASDTSGLDAAFDENGNLAWPNLKKIDISSNTEWKVRTAGAAGKLFDLDQADKLELGYSYNRLFTYDDAERDGYDAHVKRGTKLADLPHVDANGIRYVTYDDFGARATGGFDDFTAMINAHTFANAAGCEVRATAGKTYHIYKRYNSSWFSCYTNVDWQGANFVVHDEDIETTPSRFVPLMCFHPSGAGKGESTSAYKDRVTITNSADGTGALTLNGLLTKKTTSIAGLNPELDAAIAGLNAKGYSRYYIMAYDATTKHYIRFGQNANGGSDTWDGFIVDSAGNLVVNPNDAAANKVQWDFKTVTKFIITPIPSEQSYVRNGHFTHTVPKGQRETPSKRVSGKGGYYYRNIQVRECANVEVSGITDTVDDHDGLSGSYYSFLQVFDCAEVELSACDLFARKYSTGGRSTYGLVLTNDTDITVTDLKSNGGDEAALLDGNRWGVMGNNRCKDITFERCVVNRIDAHEGYYNMKARDCVIGYHGFTLIGQGPLLIEGTEVTSNNFISLRYDYGGTWDGDARIIGCVHHAIGTDTQGIISTYREDIVNGVEHDYGYELHFPNLYVRNFTVDEQGRTPGKNAYYIVPNHSFGNYVTKMPSSFWPDTIDIEDINFVGYDQVFGSEPQFRLVSNEVGTIAGKLAGYSARDVSFDGRSGHTDVKLGEQLLSDATLVSTDATVAPKASVSLADFSLDAMNGRELAVEYTGTLPRVTLMDAGWHGWEAVDAYYIERGDESNVAYFSEAAIRSKWAAKEGTTWTNRAGESGIVGALKYVSVETASVDAGSEKFAGTTTLSAIALVQGLHEHAWGTWERVLEPTCDAPGSDSRVCSVCQSVETRPVEATGHFWGAWEKLDGAQHRRVCSHEPSHVQTAGHDWDAGKVTKAPTTSAQGERTYACATCGATKVESIAKLPSASTEVGSRTTAQPIGISKAAVNLSKSSYVYDGKVKKPAVTLRYAGRKLVAGVDYSVSYSANKNVGTAKAIVTGKGSFSGSKSVTFKINPKPTSVSKLTAAKKGFTAKWKKQATQTSGYQLQYSLKSSFKSAKTIAIPKPKTASKKVMKLKAKKKYYVRVRTYKKSGGKTYYSSWSKAKVVATKK